MSEAADASSAPTYVVVDCNEWIRLKWLGSQVGQTFLSALRADSTLRLVIPEVLDGELDKHRAEQARSLLSRLEGVISEIGTVTGDEIFAGMGTFTEEDLDVAMRERLAAIRDQILYTEMQTDEVRRALRRVNAETAPNGPKNQQMKDTLLWEACVTLAAEHRVFFVTGDKAFFTGRDPDKGLAPELAAEEAVRQGRLRAFASVEKALQEFAPHRVADNAELPDVRVKDLIAAAAVAVFDRSAIAADLRPVVAVHGIVPSYLRTDVSHVFAVSFGAFFYINQGMQDRPHGEAAVAGQCRLDARTASIDSMNFELIRWTLTDPSDCTGGRRKDSTGRRSGGRGRLWRPRCPSAFHGASTSRISLYPRFSTRVAPVGPVKRNAPMNLREDLANGRTDLVRIGDVRPGPAVDLPFVVVDAVGHPIDAVSLFLRDLMLGDARPSTCRSYAQDLLRWLRLLSMVDTYWERAARAEVALLVAWMRNAPNPQRRRTDPAQCGAVNLRTGKPNLSAGYAKTTINHALTVIGEFYDFHIHAGRGSLVNPVPASAQRRRMLAHRSPLEPVPVLRRAPLRQRVPTQQPRSIPDSLWDELFAQMRCLRDRALLACYVCSAARASELLALCAENIDWSRMLMWVPRKGSDALSAVPLSPQAAVLLAAYLHEVGLPPAGTPVWRTRRGSPRPLDYAAARRILQRANAVLGTNWSLHDLRHTTCTRMANDPALTLPEIQQVMRHAHAATTERYMPPRLDELIDKLQAHYQRPTPPRVAAPGYDPADLATVFGD